MTDNRNLLTLTPEEKQDLERWAQSRTLPAGDVFRARLILALAEGQSYREIAKGMRTSAATIARWRTRFEQHRLAGLEGRHQGSKPRTATPAVQARVARRVQQKPRDGSTHWSCRRLARELGVSKSTVQRILTQARLKPHRLQRYLASDDPDFEAKAADIIGLYLRSDPEWRSKFFHLALRRGRKIAKVAMARRLAVRLYWMWRKGWDYEQMKKFGSHAGQPGHRHGVQQNTE